MEIIKPAVQGFDRAYSINIVAPTLDFWKDLGFTPNGLTTLGLFSSAAAVHSFWTQKPLLFVLFIAMRMYFDYADGMFARKYKMTSNIGDYYDHTVDAFFMIGFLVVMWKLNYPAAVFILLFGAISVFSINMACIERSSKNYIHKSSTQVMSMFEINTFCDSACPMKYFDNSCLYLVMCLIVLFVGAKSK
jgi:phosphatidylglycerophosphate synthase